VRGLATRSIVRQSSTVDCTCSQTTDRFASTTTLVAGLTAPFQTSPGQAVTSRRDAWSRYCTLGRPGRRMAPGMGSVRRIAYIPFAERSQRPFTQLFGHDPGRHVVSGWFTCLRRRGGFASGVEDLADLHRSMCPDTYLTPPDLQEPMFAREVKLFAPAPGGRSTLSGCRVGSRGGTTSASRACRFHRRPRCHRGRTGLIGQTRYTGRRHASRSLDGRSAPRSGRGGENHRGHAIVVPIIAF
jgi:hypothetical protein